ncbi:hypothetical protein [Streptomyces sp. CO7]
MSTTRRSLLTAAAAGALLGALSFVPSANATMTPEEPEPRSAAAAPAAAGAESGSGVHTMTTVSDTTSTSATVHSQADGTELADTGAFDTTPYIMGGTAFLGIGAAFVAYSVRRERMGL